MSRAFNTDGNVRTLLSIQGVLDNFDVDVNLVDINLVDINLVDIDDRGVQRLHRAVAECNQIRIGIEKIISRYRGVINYVQSVTSGSVILEKTIDIELLRKLGLSRVK